MFTFEGHRYAIQGAGSVGGEPQILLYACDDLTAWRPLGALLTSADPVAAEPLPRRTSGSARTCSASGIAGC